MIKTSTQRVRQGNVDTGETRRASQRAESGTGRDLHQLRPSRSQEDKCISCLLELTFVVDFTCYGGFKTITNSCAHRSYCLVLLHERHFLFSLSMLY